MKFRHILMSSVAMTALTFAACTDDNLPTPVEKAPGACLSVVTVSNGSISRADTPQPVKEVGDPNENYIHKIHVIVTTAPINGDGSGTVLKVITRSDITNEQNLGRVYGTDDEGNPTNDWQQVGTLESPLYWYDSNGTAHNVYQSSQSFRGYITSKVEFNNDRNLADDVEYLISYVERQEAATGNETYLYAVAMANIDLDKFVDAYGYPKTIAAGMSVADLRNLIYVGPLYNTPDDLFPYDPANPDTKFGWGPTGWPGGPVRFTDFAMSAVNEIKFRPEFDASGRYTFPTLVVQRMAARIDIAFGVQAVNNYSPDEKNGNNDRTSLPYITDRGWYYVGDPVVVDGKVTYPNADTNPWDGKTGPAGKRVSAPFEGSFGAGFVGLVDVTDNPGDGYIARYLYDLDVTGDDNTTGVTDGAVSDLKTFQEKNYAGQFRFPIYDEDKYLAGEGDVLITGAVFYMQSIRLLNCVNSGVYLFEQADVNGNRRYMHNEGEWQAQGSVSYPSYFIWSPATRTITDRQLTTLDDFGHRPVPCIQSGLKIPGVSRTLFSPGGDKKFGVYSILGYVGENTYINYSPDQKYTGIRLDGVTNLGHYFSDTEQLETNDGNLRTRVSVEMKMCHSFGGGGSNPRGNNMHFATVRNTVYRVYVKFYAKGEKLMVRYWFYEGEDYSFKENEYQKADFYSNILEDDRHRPVVD